MLKGEGGLLFKRKGVKEIGVIVRGTEGFAADIWKYFNFEFLEKKKKKKKKKKRTSRSFKVSNWDILEFRSQFEIRTFIFLITLDYGALINKDIESISNNFDVLCWNSPRCCPRSSPDGWIRFLFYKTCRKISQEDSVKN